LKLKLYIVQIQINYQINGFYIGWNKHCDELHRRQCYLPPVSLRSPAQKTFVKHQQKMYPVTNPPTTQNTQVNGVFTFNKGKEVMSLTADNQMYDPNMKSVSMGMSMGTGSGNIGDEAIVEATEEYALIDPEAFSRTLATIKEALAGLQVGDHNFGQHQLTNAAAFEEKMQRENKLKAKKVPAVKLSFTKSPKDLMNFFEIDSLSMFNGEIVRKKHSADFLFKDSYIWISPATRTLHWYVNMGL
jgi:hypothetical protein